MTRRSRRAARTRLLIPVLAGLLTLAACSHGEGSNQSGRAQSPQSHSGSHEAAQSIPMSGEYPVLPDGKLGRPMDWVEPHKPQLPSAATNMDAFGARYFAEYYLNLLAYSINTGNTTTLKKVSSPDCKVCQSYIDLIGRVYGDGGWVDGKNYTITQIDEPIPHPQTKGLYFVKIHAKNAPYVEYRGGELHPALESQKIIELEILQRNSSFLVKSYHAEDFIAEDESEKAQS